MAKKEQEIVKDKDEKVAPKSDAKSAAKTAELAGIIKKLTTRAKKFGFIIPKIPNINYVSIINTILEIKC